MKIPIWLKIISVAAAIFLAVLAVNFSTGKAVVEREALILAVTIAFLAMIYTGFRQIQISREQLRLRERENWQETLSREKKTIEGIIEGSPIPTFVIGRDHRIMFWNRACAELMGYDAKAMIGTDKQYLPFYPEKRPVIADLIVDNDIEGLDKYYGKKRVQQSIG